MLRIQEIHSPADRNQFLSRFDPRKTTWLVPDLRAKNYLHESIFLRTPVIPDFSVIRASELWAHFFKRLHPEFRVVQRDFALSLVGRCLQKSDLGWAKRPGASAAVFQTLEDIVGILGHPEGPSRISEWLQQNDPARFRWGPWFVEAYRAWQDLISRKYILSDWAGALLVHEENMERLWDRPLVVDMGTALMPWESEILGRMAKHVDVTILIPDTAARAGFNSAFRNYQNLDFFTQSQFDEASEKHQALAKIQVKRFSSQLSEVKAATAQVREWCESGIEASKIAIVAPDIRVYETALRHHFEMEGLPWDKRRRARMSLLPEVLGWLGRMRLRVDEILASRVEQYFFESEDHLEVQYDRFVELFGRLYDEAELEREPRLRKKILELRKDPKQELAAMEFVLWSLDDVVESSEALQRLLSSLVNQVPPEARMSVSEWLSLTQKLAVQTEVYFEDEIQDSVIWENLGSCQFARVEKLIVLGMADGFFRKTRRSPLRQSDVEAIRQDLGFNLVDREESSDDFAALWLGRDPNLEVIGCFPESDFLGDVQQPALSWQFWRTASKSSVLSLSPKKTRVDEILEAGAEAWANLDPNDKMARANRVLHLKHDLGLIAPQAFGGAFVDRISATSLSHYRECPFKYAASRLFQLSDIRALDLDLDPTREGTLLHGIVELLKQESLVQNEDFDSIIERAAQKRNLVKPHLSLWNALKVRLKKFMHSFVEFEKVWSRTYPSTRTQYLELSYDLFVSETGKIHRAPADDKSLRLRGQIDRIDTDSDNNLILLDYKRSGNNQRFWKKWLESDEFQLLLYTSVLESGALDDFDQKKVAGAFYFNLKDMDRRKGFNLSSVEGRMVESGASARLDEQQKTELLDQFKNILGETVSEMRKGRMAPAPKNTDLCPECNWRSLCRAGHLR